MKKILYLFVLVFSIFVLIFSIFFINSCSKDKVISIQVNDYINDTEFVNDFKIEDYQLVVYHKDGSIEYVNITLDMIYEEDIYKLNTPGKHSLKLFYDKEELEICFSIIEEKYSYKFEYYLEDIEGGYSYYDCYSFKNAHKIVDISTFHELPKYEGYTIEEEYQISTDGDMTTYAFYYKRNIYNLNIYDNNHLLYSEKFKYGEKIEFDFVPYKENHTFDSYSEDVKEYMGAEDYNIFANFIPVEYTYIFKNYDGSIIKQEKAIKNSVIVPPDNPMKPSDNIYTYTFVGWSNYTDGMFLSNDITFIAQYSSSLNRYSVVFKNVDGTILDVKSVEHGGTVSYEGIIPVHPANPAYIYTFTGWDKPLNNIKEDIEVTAVFQSSNVTLIVNINIDGIKTIKSINYGDSVDLPLNVQKEGHTFVGWSHNGQCITESMTIDALFIANLYNINYFIDGELYQTLPLEYGTMINFESPIISDNILFTGWNSELEVVPAYEYNVYGHYIDITELNEKYNGYEKNIKYNEELDDVNVQYKFGEDDIDSVVNAGKYTLEFSYKEVDNNNYMFVYKFDILKADSIITASDVEVVYDGEVHSIEYALNHDNAIVYTDGNSFVDAGEYNVTLYVEESENYSAATISRKLLIKKAEYDTSRISFESNEYVYDGFEKNVVISGVLPSGLTVDYVNNTLINAGEIVATAIFTGDYKNYEVVPSLYCTLVINPKKASISIDDKQSVYGDNLKEFTYSYEGFINDINVFINKEDGITVGEYLLTTEYKDTNYEIIINNGIYTITKATYNMDNVSFDDVSFIYDGTEKIITIKGQLPNGLSVTYSNNTIIDVGTITATASFTGDYNNYYEVEDIECQITITKKDATIVIDNASSVYGEELAVFTYSITGIYDRDSIDVVIIKQDGLDVGEYELTANPIHNNYNFNIITGVYRIIYADFVGIELNNKNFIYDGNSHSLEIVGLVEGLSVEYINNSQINVGTYEVVAIVTSENYNEIRLTATLSIEKKDATITIDDKTSVFGDSLVEFTYTLEGFIESIEPTIIKEEGLNAGTYVLSTTYNNDNYRINIIEGKYIITKAESIITMSTENNVFAYTGNEISLVAFANHDESILEYVNNNNVQPGTYTLEVVCPESDNYLSSKISYIYYIKYVVNFYDCNNNIIYSSYVFNGGNATFEGDLPTKESDYMYRYIFTGWDKDFIDVTTNLDIYPTFENVDILYTIIYQDYDGNTIQIYSEKLYSEAVIEPEKIIRGSLDESIAYVFNCWDSLEYEKSIINDDGNRTLIVLPIYDETEPLAQVDNKYYGLISDALSIALYGDIVTLLKTSYDYISINNDIIIQEGVTLYLPYAKDIELENANGSQKAVKFDISKRYIQLVVENATIEVYGSIVIGAETGYTTYNYGNYLQGNINGAFSEIVLGNNAHIIIGNGIDEANVICYGIIEDNSTIDAESSIIVNDNSTLSENFVIYDWKGGTYLLNNFKVKGLVSPFNRYQLPYIKSKVIIHKEAKYKGIGKIYATINGTGTFNSMPFMIIGSEIDSTTNKEINGLFTISEENGYITKKFTDENNVAVNSYTDLLQLNVYGNAKLNPLTIAFNGSTYSTDTVHFPIPYGLSIKLIDCDLEINNLFKILPGGKIEIDIDSKVTIKSTDLTDEELAIPSDERLICGLVIYDNYDYSDAPVNLYPTSTQLEAANKNTSGVLENNGALIIDSDDVWIGGNITGSGIIYKNYSCNKGYKAEVPSVTGTKYSGGITYLTLYFNNTKIDRKEIGIYE